MMKLTLVLRNKKNQPDVLADPFEHLKRQVGRETSRNSEYLVKQKRA